MPVCNIERFSPERQHRGVRIFLLEPLEKLQVDQLGRRAFLPLPPIGAVDVLMGEQLADAAETMPARRERLARGEECEQSLGKIAAVVDLQTIAMQRRAIGVERI